MQAEPRWAQVGGNAAESYQRTLVPAMFAPWAMRLADLASVRPGAQVLDVACGTGVVTRLAAQRVGRTGRVVGLDINPAMLDVARAQPWDGAAIEWIEASALDIPLPDTAFDLVLCQHGLQQISDRQAALGEMRRVLAPGGRLAVCVWSHLEGSPGMAALVAALERHVGAAAANNRRAPFALSDPRDLHRVLIDAGFRDVRIETTTEVARFASPAHLVDAQLASTPLSTLGALTEDAHRAVVHDVSTDLARYTTNELRVPMEAHLALALALA